MNKNVAQLLLNPFVKIAGWKALTVGVAGLVISAIINYMTGWHYHGLLHFGPAPNPAFYCFLSEQLIVWMIPSLIFYLGGAILSSSRIRIVDVFGTVAFSLLPLICMNLLNSLPMMSVLLKMDAHMPPLEIVQQPGFYRAIGLTLVSMVFLVLALIWMYNAVKVSCNLKGPKLWILYAIGVIGGDIACRFLIRMLY